MLHDVLAVFLTATHLKAAFDSTPPTATELETRIQEEFTKLRAQSQWELISEIEAADSDRSARYLGATWRLQQISLDTTCVWPQMSEIQWAVGTAVHVSAHPGLPDSRVAHKIASMVSYAEVFDRVLPLIAFAVPPGIHRANASVAGRQYDLDDGCHRAVAFASARKQYARAYVGFLDATR